MRPKTGRRPTLLRVALLAVFVTMLAAGMAGPALAQQRHAVVGVVDGAINPVTQRYISRLIKKGEEDGAEVVIIKLDTPGGLLSSTQKITEDLLRDRVPTVVYVYPPGGGAFSAGTFITAAANFAVMAPSTSIGAASPVGAGGEELPETIKSKVMEALAADMRGIARIRDRNPEALEASVLEAKAYDEAEALELNVVDFVVRDMTGLLAAINGRTVELVSGPRTLNTSDLELREVNMTLIEKFFFFLADPNISFLLLSSRQPWLGNRAVPSRAYSARRGWGNFPSPGFPQPGKLAGERGWGRLDPLRHGPAHSRDTGGWVWRAGHRGYSGL